MWLYLYKAAQLCLNKQREGLTEFRVGAGHVWAKGQEVGLGGPTGNIVLISESAMPHARVINNHFYEPSLLKGSFGRSMWKDPYFRDSTPSCFHAESHAHWAPSSPTHFPVSLPRTGLSPTEPSPGHHGKTKITSSRSILRGNEGLVIKCLVSYF